MKNKHYHIILASIIFAFSVWLSVNLKHEYTISLQIPIIIENLQAGKTLTYPIPKFVNVRLKGSGWLLASIYFFLDIKYHIDASAILSDKLVLTSKDLLDRVKIPPDISPVGVEPETLTLAISPYNEKKVAVKACVIINCREGYGQVGQIKLNPDSIIVGGAARLLEKIDSWETVYKKFEDVRLPIKEQIQLEEPKYYGLELLEKSVLLQIDVQPFAEKTFTGVPITVNATPPGKEVIFIPPKMNIIVRGGVEVLSKLSVNDFYATISYEKLITDSLEFVRPSLSYPEEVKVVNCQPEQFQYIIRKRL